MGAFATSLVIVVRGALLIAFGVSLIFCLFGAYISFGSLLWIFKDVIAGRTPTATHDNLGWTILFLIWTGGGMAGCWASARLFLRYGLSNLGRSSNGPWTVASWRPFLVMVLASLGGVVALGMKTYTSGIAWFVTALAALAWFIWKDVAGVIKALLSGVRESS